MKYALPVLLHFFEAHFKVHYTKGFRLTYPIPLPTSIAGIFGSMLGIERRDIYNKFKDCAFGASIINDAYENVENYTFFQYKQGTRKLGVTRLHLINEPKYVIVMAHQDESFIKNIKDQLENYVYYLPFGGQNDFFAKDWTIYNILQTSYSDKISNYIPMGYYNGIEEGTAIEILPVKHKMGSNENFYFILKGTIKSKEILEICSINNKNIALYPLDNFYIVGEESYGMG